LPKLTNFNANGCQLTNLEISNCPDISIFNVGNNLLTNTGFLNNLNPNKLTYLSIHSNNFSEHDLSFLSKFANLEKLYIDNHDQEKFEKDVYNRLSGSLESLNSLINLKILNLAGTDVNPGLQYLSDSVEKVYYDNNDNPRKESLNRLEKQIGKYNKKDKDGNYCDYQKWREANYHLVEEGDRIRAEN